jgi:transposase
VRRVDAPEPAWTREVERVIGEDEDSHDVRSRPAPQASLLKQVVPQLTAERGTRVLLAAKFIGEIADINRFQTDSQLARLAGCAPIPVSSGNSGRYRLDPGGNRQLDSAFYLLAAIGIRHDSRTAVYLPNNAPTANQP